jgi:hypothetical protein
MRMNSSTESALLVPFPKETKERGPLKRTLLFSVGPLVARRRMRIKKKKKVYSAADLDPRCLLLHRERSMDLRIHQANKLKKTNTKRRNKMKVKKDSLSSIVSSMSSSIK